MHHLFYLSTNKQLICLHFQYKNALQTHYYITSIKYSPADSISYFSSKTFKNHIILFAFYKCTGLCGPKWVSLIIRFLWTVIHISRKAPSIIIVLIRPGDHHGLQCKLWPQKTKLRWLNLNLNYRIHSYNWGAVSYASESH